jgi:hypothetical protein
MLLSCIEKMGIKLVGDACFQAVLHPLHVIKVLEISIHGIELLLKLCVVRAYFG